MGSSEEQALLFFLFGQLSYPHTWVIKTIYADAFF